MTIEERAKEYADNFVVGDSAVIADLIHKVAEESYINGATEQKKIDTEKFCEDILYSLMHDFGCDIPDVEKAKEFVKQRMEE